MSSPEVLTHAWKQQHVEMGDRALGAVDIILAGMVDNPDALLNDKLSKMIIAYSQMAVAHYTAAALK